MITDESPNVDETGPDSEDGESSSERLNVDERAWIKEVVAGKTLREALGSRRISERDRYKTIRRYLSKQHLAERLVAELSLSGQHERVNEILGYLASLAAMKALEKGDRNVILALMPKGKAAAAKPQGKASPEARGLEITAKNEDSGQS